MKHHKIKPQHKQPGFFQRHYTIVAALLCIAIFVVSSFIFYQRFPNNYREPNFYAEDGQDFARTILEKGFWHAIFTTFNGYYLWGIYSLHQLSMVVNRLFFDNEFVNLPRSIAIVSYAFFGFVATLPVVLFRNYFKPAVLGLMTLLIVFVPMIESDYAVIGTIGNLKFAFIFIAFLLLVYRHLVPNNSRLIYLVDASLLFCAYTNVTVYPMLFFALLRYWPEIKKRQIKPLLKDHSMQSLIVLGVLLLPQLYIVKTHGIPPLPGYLDNPFNFKRAIEIFVSRSFIYQFLFPVNKYLNDIIVVVGSLIILIASSLFGGKYRKIFWFGVCTVFLSTFLFVFKRTGISDFYFGYKSGGPDQFFYPQNWVVGFIGVLVFGEVVGRLKNISFRRTLYVLAFILIIAVYAPKSGSYGKNNFMEKNIGNIYAQSQADCKTNRSSFDLTIYPAAYLKYKNATKQQICTPAALYYNPPMLDLGLKPYGNNYLAELGVINKVTQTFVSPRNRLAGVSIYFSTFKQTANTPYTFVLYDSSCTKSIYMVPLKVRKISDNAFFDVKFPIIKNSENKTYCFSVISDKPYAPDPLAIQQAKTDSYEEGATTVNGKPIKEDLVFTLLYR